MDDNEVITRYNFQQKRFLFPTISNSRDLFDALAVLDAIRKYASENEEADAFLITIEGMKRPDEES